MHHYLTVPLLAALAHFLFSDARADYTAVKTANRLFEAGKLAEAAENYRNITETEPDSPNSLVAAFNLGNTLFHANRYAEAAVHFREFAAKPAVSERFRADTRFNAGNALARLAMNSDNRRQKNRLLKAALTEYRMALLLNPDDDENKINHEIISRLLDELSSPPFSGRSSVSNAGRSGAENDIVSNILEQTAMEEQSVLRNRYRSSSRTKQPGSNKDW